MANFASSTDVADRLGRSLTALETAQVSGVLTSVAALIRSEAGKAASWDPAAVPSALKELSVQKAIAAVVNPTNVAQESEGLGAYQRSTTYQRSQDGGTLLSEEEGRMVRFAVYGANAASTRSRSHIDTSFDLVDDGEINNSLGS